MDISLKVNRLLEDIFAPMSEPEQKDVDKQFVTKMKVLYQGNNKDTEKLLGDFIDRSWRFHDIQYGSNVETHPRRWKKIITSTEEFVETAKNIDDKLKTSGKITYLKLSNLRGEYKETKIYIEKDGYPHWPAIVISSDRERLTEDIFQPMSEPEQAEVEKNFEYRIGIAVHNPHTEDGSMIRDLLISNGFIYSPSVISGTGAYHKAADSTQAWSSEVHKIMNRIKETGQHAFFKADGKWSGNIYIGPYGYPTLPDITVRGERIKKK
jgi:hypothetical protein